jgi:hypothetical protein
VLGLHHLIKAAVRYAKDDPARQARDELWDYAHKLWAAAELFTAVSVGVSDKPLEDFLGRGAASSASTPKLLQGVVTVALWRVRQVGTRTSVTQAECKEWERSTGPQAFKDAARMAKAVLPAFQIALVGKEFSVDGTLLIELSFKNRVEHHCVKVRLTRLGNREFEQVVWVE